MSDDLNEKMNMKKTKMGDVITDFQKSDAPQFKGKSMEKRRKMAIAAKMAAMEETQVDEGILDNTVGAAARAGDRVIDRGRSAVASGLRSAANTIAPNNDKNIRHSPIPSRTLQPVPKSPDYNREKRNDIRSRNVDNAVGKYADLRADREKQNNIPNNPSIRRGPGPANTTTPNIRPVREPITGGRDTVPNTPERQDFVNRLRAANPQTYGRPGLRREDIINRVIDKYLPEADIFESLTNDEILLVKLDGLKENHVITMLSLFQSLDENNQMKMLGAVDTAEGISSLLDFALENGNQIRESVNIEDVAATIIKGREKITAIQESREAE